MLIKLMIENLSLVTLKDDLIPFSMINLHLLEIGVDRDEHKKMNIAISGTELNGSFFDFENNELKERKLLGSLDERKAFTIKNVARENIIDDIAKVVKDYANKIQTKHLKREKSMNADSSPKKTKKKSLVMSIEMTPDGSKNIEINVNQLRTYLAAPAFLNLLAFVQMDDSVNPPTPKPCNIALREYFFINLLKRPRS